MSDISKKLENVLLECGPFDSDEDLKAIFIDRRISSWHNRLPQARNRQQRVRKTIHFLYNKCDEAGEKALVLFLRVLSERNPPGDSCHRKLAETAKHIECAQEERSEILLKFSKKHPRKRGFAEKLKHILITIVILTAFGIVALLSILPGTLIIIIAIVAFILIIILVALIIYLLCINAEDEEIKDKNHHEENENNFK
jgi:hypothetical protein